MGTDMKVSGDTEIVFVSTQHMESIQKAVLIQIIAMLVGKNSQFKPSGLINTKLGETLCTCQEGVLMLCEPVFFWMWVWVGGGHDQKRKKKL